MKSLNELWEMPLSESRKLRLQKFEILVNWEPETFWIGGTNMVNAVDYIISVYTDRGEAVERLLIRWEKHPGWMMVDFDHDGDFCGIFEVLTYD